MDWIIDKFGVQSGEGLIAAIAVMWLGPIALIALIVRGVRWIRSKRGDRPAAGPLACKHFWVKMEMQHDSRLITGRFATRICTKCFVAQKQSLHPNREAPTNDDREWTDARDFDRALLQGEHARKAPKMGEAIDVRHRDQEWPRDEALQFLGTFSDTGTCAHGLISSGEGTFFQCLKCGHKSGFNP